MRQNKCNKVADNYSHALRSNPDCYKTQKMGDKAAKTSPSTKQFVADQFRNILKAVCRKLYFKR